jgi:hypothetical protein
MHFIRITATLIIFALAGVCAAQEFIKDAPELIEWNEYFDLSWEDFQGLPTTESVGDAGTTVEIKARPYYIKDQLYYEVNAYFNRRKSWSRGKSDALLSHEQLHFDIAELYARKIRKQIIDMRTKGVKDIKIFNAAIRKLLEQSNEVDRQYDLETLHGVLNKKQAVWEQRVKEQLMGLKDYKKKKRIVT